MVEKRRGWLWGLRKKALGLKKETLELGKKDTLITKTGDLNKTHCLA